MIRYFSIRSNEIAVVAVRCDYGFEGKGEEIVPNKRNDMGAVVETAERLFKQDERCDVAIISLEDGTVVFKYRNPMG